MKVELEEPLLISFIASLPAQKRGGEVDDLSLRKDIRYKCAMQPKLNKWGTARFKNNYKFDRIK